VISTAAGESPDDELCDDRTPFDPTQITEAMVTAKGKTNGIEPTEDLNMKKHSESALVWDTARPAMHLISEVVDTWERFVNALSPTSPFPYLWPRLILVACLLLFVMAHIYFTSYMMRKGLGFLAGFWFFGDPVFRRSIAAADKAYPHWRRSVKLQNNILRGVPTNAQLTTTILRIGERNKSPIPPPPSTTAPKDSGKLRLPHALQHVGLMVSRST
jgi:hypothetical protein